LLSLIAGTVGGAVPQLDLEAEKAVQQVCQDAIRAGLIRSAHDCSDGGLAVALAECCFSSYNRSSIGARIDLSEHLKQGGLVDDPPGDLAGRAALLFGESPSRIILTVKPNHADRVTELARQRGVPCAAIGQVSEQVGGDQLIISCDGETLIEAAVTHLEEAWRGALPGDLDRPASHH
jgi:phosphoribosylformylglycinamidine synthase